MRADAVVLVPPRLDQDLCFDLGDRLALPQTDLGLPQLADDLLGPETLPLRRCHPHDPFLSAAILARGGSVSGGQVTSAARADMGR